jgi:hypothetical protein
MFTKTSSQLFATLLVALSTACASSNAAGGSTGPAGGAGTVATGATAGSGGMLACPDFLGVQVGGPSAVPGVGPGSGCGNGSCFGCITPIEGMSFAVGMFSITDDSGVTAASLRTEPGLACAKGTSVGWAILELVVGRKTTVFDAAALGITQLRFTVETPPSSGLVPQIAAQLPDMSPNGFELMAGGQSVSIASTSTKTVFLAEFQSQDFTLDPTRLLSVGFTVSTVEHYDFCIRDLKFLDANGAEVLPTQ